MGSRLKIVRELLGHGANVDQAMFNGLCDVTPLMVASQKGHLEITRLPLEHGAAINQASNHGFTPLSAARHGGHSRVVQLLQEHGADTA